MSNTETKMIDEMKASSIFSLQNTNTRHKEQRFRTLSAGTSQNSPTRRTKGAILVALEVLVLVTHWNVAERIIVKPPCAGLQKIVFNLLNHADMVLDPVDVFEVALSRRGRDILPLETKS